MFFIASKIFWFVAEPVSLAIVVGVLGILLGFAGVARAGRSLRAGAILAVAAGLLTPLGVVLLWPLEERFPRPPADIPDPAGIIVLGGALDTEKSEARGEVYFSPDAARMIAGIELARRYPTARLVFTGGSAGVVWGRAAGGDQARKILS